MSRIESLASQSVRKDLNNRPETLQKPQKVNKQADDAAIVSLSTISSPASSHAALIAQSITNPAGYTKGFAKPSSDSASVQIEPQPVKIEGIPEQSEVSASNDASNSEEKENSANEHSDRRNSDHPSK